MAPGQTGTPGPGGYFDNRAEGSNLATWHVRHVYHKVRTSNDETTCCLPLPHIPSANGDVRPVLTALSSPVLRGDLLRLRPVAHARPATQAREQ